MLGIGAVGLLCHLTDSVLDIRMRGGGDPDKAPTASMYGPSNLSCFPLSLICTDVSAEVEVDVVYQICPPVDQYR